MLRRALAETNAQRDPIESVAATAGMLNRGPIDSVPQTNDSRHYDRHVENNYQDDGYVTAEEGMEEDEVDAVVVAAPLIATKHQTESRAD